MVDFANVMDPNEKPLTETLPVRPWPPAPDFCLREKKVSVEPFMTYYQEMVAIIEDVSPDIPDDDYYDEWVTYTESQGLTKLRRLAHQVGQLAYKEVPNPEYNEAECLSWKENMVRSYNKMGWGTSNLNPIDESVIITPDGPRVIDEGVES